MSDHVHVSSFGIAGYEPDWQTGLPTIRALYESRLVGLVGKTLAQTFLLWDENDDSWFVDAPVVLDFRGDRLELNHWKFDELSITWNSIQLDEPVNWPGDREMGLFKLAWRADPFEQLAYLAGQQLQAVQLLEYVGQDAAHGMVAVNFVLDNGQMTVVNGLDENSLHFSDPGKGFEIHSL